jgi:hypothetical protein
MATLTTEGDRYTAPRNDRTASATVRLANEGVET